MTKSNPQDRGQAQPQLTQRLIVKCQRPVLGANNPILIYNEDRTIMSQCEVTPEEMEKLFGVHYKVYAFAEYDPETGILTLKEAAIDQSQSPDW